MESIPELLPTFLAGLLFLYMYVAFRLFNVCSVPFVDLGTAWRGGMARSGLFEAKQGMRQREMGGRGRSPISPLAPGGGPELPTPEGGCRAVFLQMWLNRERAPPAFLPCTGALGGGGVCSFTASDPQPEKEK